ncbi:LacI family transcriptional regulator [bacterium]|nr:MAG: LacI family transcriptional regulator [bacterium]
MRTRLKDVAERVNLSPALVSGVLNGKANVWASEETRARVFQAASELNYQPSNAARALSHGRTDTVALVYRRLSGTVYRLAYTGLVDTFSEQLQGRSYDLLVKNFATQEEVLESLRKLARAHTCDAVILWGREADTEAQGELLDSLNVRFLVKGRHEVRHPNWYQIDFDHEGMMKKALDHVVELGHRRIAFLGFPHNEGYVQCLRQGFVDAHAALLGERPNPRLMAACEDELESNSRAIEAMLTLPQDQRPTGFVIGSGNYAWHALESCLARRGEVLTLNPDGFAAAGIASYYFTLTFGEALAYQGIEIDNLAHETSRGLLDAVLRGTHGERIVRFLPDLTFAPTLGLNPAKGTPELVLSLTNVGHVHHRTKMSGHRSQ